MGSSQYTYVGPFVRTPRLDRQVPEQVPASCSSNPRHRVERGAKFCGQCGSPVTPAGQKLVKKDGYVSPHDCDPGYEDLMTCFWGGDATMGGIWIPNVSGFGSSSSSYDDGVLCAEITPELIAGQIEKLRSEFSDYIAHMEERHGFKVEVRYGVLTYWA